MAARGAAREQKRLNFVMSLHQTGIEVNDLDDDDSPDGANADISTVRRSGRFLHRLGMRVQRTAVSVVNAPALWTVASHILITLVIPIPLVLLSLFAQHEAAQFSYHGDDFFVMHDVLVGPRPRTLDWGSHFIAWQNKVIMYVDTLHLS